MHKKLARKALAAALAATMIMGNGVLASADTSVITGNGVTSQGEVDGLVNLDVVSVELSTDADIDLDFILDPQGLIWKSVNDADSTAKEGYDKSMFAAQKTLYFKNVDQPSTGAVEAADAKYAASENVKVTIDTEADVTTASYIYLSGRKWYQNDSGSVNENTLSAGWYVSGTEDKLGSSTTGIDVAPAKVTTFPGATVTNADGKTLADGDTVSFTAAVTASAGTAATYKYTDTSDVITATNKGFVDVNICLTAEITDLGDKITMTSDKTFANDTKPTIYLGVVEGNATSASQAINTGKTKTYVTNKIAKNVFANFGVSYNIETKTYDVKKTNTDYTTYTFKLTGAANANGEWAVGLKDAKPKIALTWNISKQSVASVNATDEGLITLSGLTADANYGTCYALVEDGSLVDFATYEDRTIGLGSDKDNPTWTAKDGGSFTMQIGAETMKKWAGKKVTIYLYDSLGNTATKTVTIKAAS